MPPTYGVAQRLSIRGENNLSVGACGGAGSEDRTRDLKITNLALYQLSYPGALIFEPTIRP
jgi:hypothetical protein